MKIRALWSQTHFQKNGFKNSKSKGRFWTFIFVQKAKSFRLFGPKKLEYFDVFRGFSGVLHHISVGFQDMLTI
jgi:hypothetical protein